MAGTQGVDVPAVMRGVYSGTAGGGQARRGTHHQFGKPPGGEETSAGSSNVSRRPRGRFEPGENIGADRLPGRPGGEDFRRRGPLRYHRWSRKLAGWRAMPTNWKTGLHPIDDNRQASRP